MEEWSGDKDLFVRTPVTERQYNDEGGESKKMTVLTFWVWVWPVFGGVDRVPCKEATTGGQTTLQLRQVWNSIWTFFKHSHSPVVREFRSWRKLMDSFPKTRWRKLLFFLLARFFSPGGEVQAKRQGVGGGVGQGDSVVQTGMASTIYNFIPPMDI